MKGLVVLQAREFGAGSSLHTIAARMRAVASTSMHFTRWKAAPMVRKRTLNMSVRVASPRSLKPNPNNPFKKESPEARREGMIQSLVAGLAVVIRQKSEACNDVSVVDDLSAA
ncbi:MAG: hypothetical protein JNM56_10330 [Planctomycetia bacterium]|nr:hypothetical protein [Planctomycetia bacterium]